LLEEEIDSELMAYDAVGERNYVKLSCHCYLTAKNLTKLFPIKYRFWLMKRIDET